MRLGVRLFISLFLGMAVSSAAAYLSSPRFWDEKRVMTKAEFLFLKGTPDESADFLLTASLMRRNRSERDRLSLEACQKSSLSNNLLKSLEVCKKAAEGPRRMAQAQAWLISGRIYDDLGFEREAISVYQSIADVYWDHHQAVEAKRELARLTTENNRREK